MMRYVTTFCFLSTTHLLLITQPTHFPFHLIENKLYLHQRGITQAACSLLIFILFVCASKELRGAETTLIKQNGCWECRELVQPVQSQTEIPRRLASDNCVWGRRYFGLTCRDTLRKKLLALQLLKLRNEMPFERPLKDILEKRHKYLLTTV